MNATPYVQTMPVETNIPDLFLERGLRCTRQRIALYEALHATKSHPTADQLFRSVTEDCPGLSLATVYNTLEAFCRAGLAQKLSTNDGSARYDATVENHIHCRSGDNSRVADVPDDLGRLIFDAIPPELLQQIEDEIGFKAEQINIEMVGEFVR